jgi:hypothetical protein
LLWDRDTPIEEKNIINQPVLTGIKAYPTGQAKNGKSCKALPAAWYKHLEETYGRITFLILWLSRSATMRLPLLSKAIALGLLNWATLPGPSANPGFPEIPAIVFTIPSGVIMRMQWFPESDT